MAPDKLEHIDPPPNVLAFREHFIACTTWEKTTDNVTFYKMYGQPFVRSKSSLTRKKVLHSELFARTRHNAGILAQAAAITAPMYNALTADWRCHDLYRKLVGIAAKLLHAGMEKEEVPKRLQEELYALGYRIEWPAWNLPPQLEEWIKEENEAVKAPTKTSAKKLCSKSKRADTRDNIEELNITAPIIIVEEVMNWYAHKLTG
jgi:hypothetical protein